MGKLIESRNKDGVAVGTAESDLPQSGVATAIVGRDDGLLKELTEK